MRKKELLRKFNGTLNSCSSVSGCRDQYPNVPLTVLQRKGTEGARVHVANPKSHNCNIIYSIEIKHFNQ